MFFRKASHYFFINNDNNNNNNNHHHQHHDQNNNKCSQSLVDQYILGFRCVFSQICKTELKDV